LQVFVLILAYIIRRYVTRLVRQSSRVEGIGEVDVLQEERRHFCKDRVGKCDVCEVVDRFRGAPPEGREAKSARRSPVLSGQDSFSRNHLKYESELAKSHTQIKNLSLTEFRINETFYFIDSFQRKDSLAKFATGRSCFYVSQLKYVKTKHCRVC